jgi:hypothetical protein
MNDRACDCEMPVLRALFNDPGIWFPAALQLNMVGDG